ncbi:DUF3558 domain-containing protein [Amycolatopsis sp. H20-H5]|uniref:DUF3558 domain-containing protein n=1 Tax=Amycolatopsis sp. H20-H5 TaxID=3046309 RepID=UPI002DB91F69|nr:DUF3558 domain-containing protein [Amycolatopsis sp. H20-H5]MEC3978186.1 DUF3558 domain-containing protein [Amycolatopsis sp. H20-H5]
MNRAFVVGIAATALLTLAACSTPVDNQTPSASSGPSTSAPASGKLAAPQVANPLDASKFEQDPCAVLSQAQASQVANLITSRKATGDVAPICTWSDTDHNTVAFGFIPGNGGLSTSYKSQDSKSGYFAVAPDVVGYPAVYGAPYDDRGDGGCQVAVGVSNDEVITVGVTFRKPSPYYSDPCSLAVKAAEAAVTTIKSGA